MNQIEYVFVVAEKRVACPSMTTAVDFLARRGRKAAAVFLRGVAADGRRTACEIEVGSVRSVGDFCTLIGTTGARRWSRWLKRQAEYAGEAPNYANAEV